jgi:hypothetical protein
VLGDLLALKYVHWLAGGGGYTSGNPAVFGAQVGPADRRCVAPVKLIDKLAEPIRIGKTIIIRVGNYGASGRLQAGIPRRA